ncbi:hypothetical protein [Methylorubrum extorquens]|uniref:Uncharacterized protein n=1 Tax=Methylorubrum extorquens TaxID=408 RepID=A0AAX3WIN7_METEX|nr:MULTISPECIES: hypothetical protein [Methylobacteriaceae]KQQ15729.1 hypothetical protein ASF56_23685 [Methylobacterium sp. Leaf122]WHQ71383.1 hypothetical protein KEC54_07440 [Methylorubrum extorquens]
MTKRINTISAAIFSLSLGFAASPVLAQTIGVEHGVAHRTSDGRMSPRNAIGGYDSIIARQRAHSNDDASAAGGNAEQPERLVPQFGQE